MAGPGGIGCSGARIWPVSALLSARKPPCKLLVATDLPTRPQLANRSTIDQSPRCQLFCSLWWLLRLGRPDMTAFWRRRPESGAISHLAADRHQSPATAPRRSTILISRSSAASGDAGTAALRLQQSLGRLLQRHQSVVSASFATLNCGSNSAVLHPSPYICPGRVPALCSHWWPARSMTDRSTTRLSPEGALTAGISRTRRARHSAHASAS